VVLVEHGQGYIWLCFGFYWLLLAFTGFCLVLLGFSGFYYFSLEKYRAATDIHVTINHSEFTGFTGFYWLLLAFTSCFTEFV